MRLWPRLPHIPPNALVRPAASELLLLDFNLTFNSLLSSSFFLVDTVVIHSHSFEVCIKAFIRNGGRLRAVRSKGPIRFVWGACAIPTTALYSSVEAAQEYDTNSTDKVSRKCGGSSELRT